MRFQYGSGIKMINDPQKVKALLHGNIESFAYKINDIYGCLDISQGSQPWYRNFRLSIPGKNEIRYVDIKYYVLFIHKTPYQRNYSTKTTKTNYIYLTSHNSTNKILESTDLDDSYLLIGRDNDILLYKCFNLLHVFSLSKYDRILYDRYNFSEDEIYMLKYKKDKSGCDYFEFKFGQERKVDIKNLSLSEWQSKFYGDVLRWKYDEANIIPYEDPNLLWNDTRIVNWRCHAGHVKELSVVDVTLPIFCGTSYGYECPICKAENKKITVGFSNPNYMLEREIQRKQLNEKINDIKKLTSRVESEDVWETFDKNTPFQIRYQFEYPNGKNGDIDMYIATQCGEVSQLDEMHYSALLKTIYKDELLLLVPFYVTNVTRSEIKQFLYEYNVGHKLRQYCDDVFSLGFNASSSSDTEEIIKERNDNLKIRQHGIEVANRYMEKVRLCRNKLYEGIITQGRTSGKWVSEKKAYQIVKSIFPDAVYQYHAAWLGSQSLDIYIPSLKTGIEYQGIQHFNPISYFGGNEGFEATKNRDLYKREKCKKYGVKLIEWRYDEPLTKDYIFGLLKNVDK